MGLLPLGGRWRRRIERVTGLSVVHASGAGGYEFEFTTSDHEHCWFDLKAYRVWVRMSPQQHPDIVGITMLDRLPAISVGVWGKYGPGECHFASCRTYFPADVEQQDRRRRIEYLDWRLRGVR